MRVFVDKVAKCLYIMLMLLVMLYKKRVGSAGIHI